MVFAKTSKCASRLSEQVRTRALKKTYYAVVELDNNHIWAEGSDGIIEWTIIKVDAPTPSEELPTLSVKLLASMTVGKIRYTCPSEPGDWKEAWGFKGRYSRQLEEEQVFVNEMCDVPYRWVTQIKFISGSDSHSEKHHPPPPTTPPHPTI